MKKILLIFTLLSLFLLGACGETTTSSITDTPMASNFDQAALPQKGEEIAVINTTYGNIKIKFFPKQAPETVKNFVELTKKTFYDGIDFHRVIPDFMIQGGDPLGNGTGGETYLGPKTYLKDEISPDLKHIYGAVSMANAGPNTATSQFFIVQAKGGTPWLNGKHAVFGQVFEGMDVVNKIAGVPRDSNDKPEKQVKMMKVEISKY